MSCIKTDKKPEERGYVLIGTLMFITMLLTLLGAYIATTSHELASMRYAKGSSNGFYAAEAGLNLRAEQIRNIFVGFNLPEGDSTDFSNPCNGANGSEDFECKIYNFNNRDVTTFTSPHPEQAYQLITIPAGEKYQNLNAQEYRYISKAMSYNNQEKLEANLELQFKSRLVPLFQFAAFYNKDLEILPGPEMILSGPVHTNGDLYVNANKKLQIDGQVTTAGDLYRGRKDKVSCGSNPVQVKDPDSWRSISCSVPNHVPESSLNAWNGMIKTNVSEVTIPGPEVFDPEPGSVYWDRADFRIVMQMDSSDNVESIEVRDSSNNNIADATVRVTDSTDCPSNPSNSKMKNDSGLYPNAAVTNDTIYNFREKKNIAILDIDLQALLTCIDTYELFDEENDPDDGEDAVKELDDDSDGGLVFHFTIRGPHENSSANKYGVRIKNAAEIQATSGGAPSVQGFTAISDQAFYVQGDFNSISKIPAAVMADSLNVLSNNWNDSNSNKGKSSRIASNTTINSAFLSGTDDTGGVDGYSGYNKGNYNGGLENYPRFHEKWSNKTLLYRGSFVSLWKARHVSGKWGSQSYSPPKRDWNYDTSFNNAANLPPITPRFVYLKQELFVRDFEQ